MPHCGLQREGEGDGGAAFTVRPPAMRAVGRGLGLQIWAGGCEAAPWDPSLF